jgi:hypothetical protein
LRLCAVMPPGAGGSALSGTTTTSPATIGAPDGGAALATDHCTVSGRFWPRTGL